MGIKLRLLLTQKCSARCAYCHNEGQGKTSQMLSLESIRLVLDQLTKAGKHIKEIVLSGGEPTLHPDLPAIARLCRVAGARVSMNTHGGHPAKIAAALPWLHELKIHVDSFDPQRQRTSMGIGIAPVLRSIDMARRKPGLRILINHPLHSIEEACETLGVARLLGVGCKLIELHDTAGNHPKLEHMPLRTLGYLYIAPGTLLHPASGHSVHARTCTPHNTHGSELFIGADGVRHHLDGAIVGRTEHFSIKMLPKS